MTSYLPDRMALPTEFRVDDAVAFYHDFFLDFDAAKADAMLRDLKLEPKQRISAMSKGTQEKMQLCLTMSRAAKLYLLDEPLGGVDFDEPPTSPMSTEDSESSSGSVEDPASLAEEGGWYDPETGDYYDSDGDRYYLDDSGTRIYY